MPWCREFVKLVGEENFLYIAEEALHEERKSLGWNTNHVQWVRYLTDSPEQIQNELENCEILIMSLRRFDLIKKRIGKNLRTYYMFERWFKPPFGSLRMFHPGYYKMCKDFSSFYNNPYFRLLPIGAYAVSDIMKMKKCLMDPFAHFWGWNKSEGILSPIQQIGWDNMRLWGYFVEPGTGIHEVSPSQGLKLFWCGRMLDWKRVDTPVKAAVSLLKKDFPVTLTLIGHGPEEVKLRKLAGKWLDRNIFFKPPAKIDEIRNYMQSNDVYVLSSDGGEGWGAALNEAMNEGMIPVGTYEAGSSATMIRHGINGFLYHSMKAKELADILSHIWALKQSEKDQEIRKNALQTIHEIWSPENAAVKLLEDCKTWIKE
jgi:glycosyltransferase involved in cell wall biosynthesis